MAGTSTAFEEFIAEEIQQYKGVYVPVKAGLLRRALIRWAPCDKLHPNPDDEFCSPKVGPNYRIVSEYMDSFRRERLHSKRYCEEAVTVEKIRPDGYLILNGHHRWAAALRLGVPALFRYLNKKGYDIWVYTAGYYSADYIQRLFKKHHVHVTGAITGTRRKVAGDAEVRKELTAMIAAKYPETVHVDNETVLRIKRKKPHPEPRKILIPRGALLCLKNRLFHEIYCNYPDVRI